MNLFYPDIYLSGIMYLYFGLQIRSSNSIYVRRKSEKEEWYREFCDL